VNKTFFPHDWVKVPDETEVAAFLNATDSTNTDLPWQVLGEVSIAAGRIRGNTQSWVHMHPVVTVITYVTSGELRIRMKDGVAERAYDLRLHSGQAAVAEPGTLMQLCNDGSVTAEVLYIVSPSYVFDEENKELRYDDAVLIARTWNEVETRPDIKALRFSREDVLARREQAKRRLEATKQKSRTSQAE
jgi:mannose-6-phosphate isomerase-like protein (cupin superfamily)